MPLNNPLQTSREEQFVVGESDFAFFSNHAGRAEGAVLMLCRAGRAEALANQVSEELREGALVLLLPGSLFMLTGRTEDFRMSYCVFSRQLFAEAAFRLAPTFFQVLNNRPISYPTPHHIQGADAWFRMAEYTYRDKGNVFRDTIIKNRLQNILLDSYDKLLRYSPAQTLPETTTRQTELFHRFAELVHEHCASQREVSFYADRLCISTRYLSTIVRDVVSCSAKEIIDHAVTVEIKLLLQSTDLSIQEIADRLRFPDQSYLGRYFKKHAGMTPSEFRNTKK